MVEFTGSNGSGLDTSVYGSALTKALNKIAPGQGKDAYELAQLLTPPPREISGPELALQFFSNMAANASQPGSTVLSSAASAVKPTADEYIRQVEANRKAKEATGPLAISLAKALKPDKVTAGAYKNVIIDKGDGVLIEDVMNPDQITAAKKAGFKVSFPTKDSRTTFTKPYEVLITDVEAYNSAYPNNPLGSDNKVFLTNKQLDKLEIGSFDILDDDKDGTAKARKEYQVPPSKIEEFKTRFSNIALSPDGVVLLDLEQLKKAEDIVFSYNKPTDKAPVAPKTYQVPPNNIEAFKLKFPLVAIDPDGIVLLNSRQFLDAQNLVFSYDKPTGTSEKERGIETLNRISGGWNYETSSWNEGVSAEDRNEYGIKYQMLMQGYETTKMVDGREQTIKVPGIDLTVTTLPVPEGFDTSKILNDRARDFGSQSVDAGFAQRMLFSEGLVRNVLAEGYRPNPSDVFFDNVGKIIGSSGLSADGQRFFHSSTNFIAALLRKESGAAISAEEYSNGLMQYFPRVGDTPEVIAEKQARRDSAISGMVRVSGDAFEAIYPEAVPFLSFVVNGETTNILNPRGYSSSEMAKILVGRGLYFDTTILNMGVDELRGMLGKPEGTYTSNQLNKIAARLDELLGG